MLLGEILSMVRRFSKVGDVNVQRESEELLIHSHLHKTAYRKLCDIINLSF